MSASPASWGRRPVDPFDGVGDGSFMVFVPAIMGFGLVFSAASLVRDAIRKTTGRARQRRIALETTTTVNELLGRDVRSPAELGLLQRGSYIGTAIASLMVAAGVAAASITEYVRSPAGGQPGWLLAAGLTVAVMAVVVATACSAVAWRWPAAPAWALPLLRALPLTHHPGRRLDRPRRLLTDGTIIAALATALLTWLAKTQTDVLAGFDEPVHDAIVDMAWIERLSVIDVFGSTVISIGSVVVIAMSGFRCRVMAFVYPGAFVSSWLATALIQELVERTRPSGFGEVQAFPSGHMVQAVFIAGLLPTALAVLFSLRPSIVRTLRSVLSAFVVATALIRIHRSDHWPTDAIAGVLLGLTVVFGAHWVVAHRWWHQRCSSCRWSPTPDDQRWGRALYDLTPWFERVLARVGAFTAVAASAGLFVATATVGLPARQADDGLGPAISEPLQLGLAAVVGIAGLLAWRWRAAAAFTVALCATGLGLLASIEYEPPMAFALTVLLLVPAVMLWLAWQHHATVGAIFALAVFTATTLTATALGSREIYGHYLGPTHPASAAEPLHSDAAWLWLGGVSATEATVVAGGLPERALVSLFHWGADRPVAEVESRSDEDGIARFALVDLPPASAVSYAIRIGSQVVDRDEPDRTFTTFAEGPQDLVVMGASGARTGSNAAVFDRIVRSQPDLWISLGDMHYADLTSPDPDDHLAQYAKAMQQPGQSALYGSVPTVHVWDDHDYGPNDSDSTSPSRPGALLAYRQAVPSYSVDPDPDAPISQAFTIGRVRFVVSDTRSHRTDETMLGQRQLDWLIGELVESAEMHALVVWVNPNPWISEQDAAGDDWSAYPDERRRIADALAAADVRNLVSLSGDAHMVAIDDGTNSDYSSDRSGGFPILQAAALDRPGSIKGGPYSHGAVGGSGQFGRIVIRDDGGDVVTVQLTGETWEGEVLLAYEFDVDVPPGAGPDTAPKAS